MQFLLPVAPLKPTFYSKLLVLIGKCGSPDKILSIRLSTAIHLRFNITVCYDHAQLRVLSGYSGRIAALQLNSSHGRTVILPLSTTLGLIPVQSLLHLAVYPALT